MKLYESIRKNLKESSYGNEYIVYVMEQTGTGSYQSKEVDRVYSEEQAEDRCAELRAETGCNTWYETVSSGSDDYEYDDGDTNWAAEEAADADERFENRYMGGGNGATFNESNRKMTDYEKTVKRHKENEEAFVKVDGKDGHFVLVYPNSVSGNTSYFADFFAADGKYVGSSYVVPDNLDSETMEKLKTASSDNYYAKPLWFNNKKLYNDYRSSIEEQLRDGALDDPEYVETLSDDEFKDLVDTWVLDKENKEIFEDHIKYDPKYAKYFYKNGVSIKEAEEVSFDEIETRMSNATTYDELYAAVSLIEDPKIRANAEEMLDICQRDGDSVEEAYSITTTEYVDPYRNDENTIIKEAEEWEKALDSGKVINVYDRSKHFAPAKFFKYGDKIYYNDDHISCGNWFEHPQKGPKEIVKHIKGLLKNEDPDYDDVDYTVDVLEEQPDILYNNDKEQTSIRLRESVEYNGIYATITPDDRSENKGGFLWQIYNDENCDNEIDSYVVHKEDLGDNYNENYKKAEEMVLDYIKNNYDNYKNLKEMDNSNGLTNIKFEEYCKDKLSDLGTVDVKDLDGNTVQVKVAFEQPIRDYGNCKVLDSEDAIDKLGTDGETIEFVDEKGEYHNSPMVSPVTILSRLEFNKIDNDFYKSMIQHWNEIKDLFESEDDWKKSGETADKIHEEFRKAKDRQESTLEKICKKYGVDVGTYLYVDGYGSFEDLVEDLQACDKLNESYAVVEYWGNDWKSKEKVINGKTTKEVEKKVLKLADKNEVIATRQASADLKTSEVLCDMGDGVQRWDYNNNKFEEMDESEKKKYWTYY